MECFRADILRPRAAFSAFRCPRRSLGYACGIGKPAALPGTETYPPQTGITECQGHNLPTLKHPIQLKVDPLLRTVR